VHLLVYENLAVHTRISLLRAVGGLTVGAVLGPFLGFAFGGFSPRLEKAAAPLVGLASQANPVVLFHVVVLFLGIGEISKVTVIAWLTTWPIAFSATAGLRTVDPNLLRVGRAFGLTPLGLFRRIILPWSMPLLFIGLRLAAGYSFIMLIAAEMMGTSSGLGWFVVQSQESYSAPRIFAAAVLTSGLAFVTDSFLSVLEHTVVYWTPRASCSGVHSGNSRRIWNFQRPLIRPSHLSGGSGI
jgi:NitT/TauT family transport system permease protein